MGRSGIRSGIRAVRQLPFPQGGARSGLRWPGWHHIFGIDEARASRFAHHRTEPRSARSGCAEGGRPSGGILSYGRQVAATLARLRAHLARSWRRVRDELSRSVSDAREETSCVPPEGYPRPGASSVAVPSSCTYRLMLLAGGSTVWATNGEPVDPHTHPAPRQTETRRQPRARIPGVTKTGFPSQPTAGANGREIAAAQTCFRESRDATARTAVTCGFELP